MGLSRSQALITSLAGLTVGGGATLLAAFNRVPFRKRNEFTSGKSHYKDIPSQIREPNPSLEIEQPKGIMLSTEEDLLLRGLFNHYRRLLIQQEFHSGYSGARTFLLVPIRADGKADAPTIAKIGSRTVIEREYANYENYVKHTLPPVTARIQSHPIRCRECKELAVLKYTFIGQPGVKPVALRQALLDNPDPQLLHHLFHTFGTNWWMQRVPWTFRLGLEYDRLLPPHWILEPESGSGSLLDGRAPPI